ncbi:universal stress protein [Streptomyces sp. NBC_01340]|uniref:universal stress protein n=1 Tax=unclassified Streptomyces TaxID=2593676 RepID=UPI00225AC94C|nr:MULTISPECIES: universal stress protein [unclassified Streptomyces]MCX4458923.1 universal stress protein [Streptomyces sp. NBC_01719]MCX4498280.1 universal stress protein [Streptomyces sp. NBC_01728]WSI42796.1 universal stress protein [Streptomyces sp. NBC_01340]
MNRRVVAAIDGSPASVAAADWAARQALCRNLPLSLVYVSPERPSGEAIPVSTAAPRGGVSRLISEEAHRDMVHSELEILTVQLEGNPRKVLLREAAGAEMLVLGSRPLRSSGGFVLGGLGLHLAAHADQPVIIVRQREEAEGGRVGEPVHAPIMLLGLDTENRADDLIDFAFRAAQAAGAGLRIVGAAAPPVFPLHHFVPVSPEERVRLEERERPALERALEGWAEKFPEVQVDTAIVVGHADEVLVDESRGADLVIVGRRRTVGPHHLGAVAHAVVHHAPCSVAVVPHN